MEVIQKEKCLIARDGSGNLIPVEVTLETHPDKPKVMMTPLTKGEFQEIVNVPNKEDELIRLHIKDPSFTEDEFKHIKPVMYGAFKMALLSLTTDVSQKDIQSSTSKALLETIEAKKKSTQAKVD